MKLLVVRNDRLGDFMLAWPALAQLRTSLPAWEIHLLVPAYTRPLAEICPFVDGVIEDPQAGAAALARRLRPYRFDALLALLSSWPVAAGGLLARIPYRLAPATKLFQLLYTRRELQRRSRSAKPEWNYNLDLALRLLRDFGVAPAALPGGPWLAFPPAEIASQRAALARAHGLDPAGRLVFIHPGSGGSAATFAPEQWARCAELITAPQPLGFLIGAGPGEEPRARAVVRAISNAPAAVVSGGDLVALARRIAAVDLFVSGSTGPLHVAGALDVPTVGLYPRHRSGSPLRWQTLNTPARRVALTPPPQAPEQAVDAIDPAAAARAASELLAASIR